MRYVLVLLGLMLANTAEAIDCNTPPSCESLGYSQTKDKNCIENGYLNCPFDSSYSICVQHNCAKLGFTNTDKTSWCDEIVTCKDDSNYTLCNHLKPEPVSCEVGDVYYADGSCGKVNDYVKDSSPKPVGVVYYISDGGAHGKVINLHDLGRGSDDLFDPANPYQTSDNSLFLTNKKYFHWGVYDTDIPDLTNWGCSGSDNNYLTVAKTGDHSNPFWSAGKSYTEIIAKAQSNNLKYAAPATLAFYPPAVSEDDPKVGKGKWYLPTLGELMDLYGYDYNNVGATCESTTGATGTTKNTVNATLQALKSKSAGNAETLTNSYYWSSSEYGRYNSSHYSWRLGMTNGHRHYDYKYTSFYVRASLEF